MRSTYLAALVAGVLATTGTAVLAGSTSAVAAPRAAVAHDDFNGDGYPDLVTAAPKAAVGGKAGAGFVSVLYGSSSGIDTARKVVLTQSSAGVPGTPESGDAFGASVASADLDGDGYADLAIGVPGEDIDSATDAGGITVVWGSAGGLTGTSSWLQSNTVGTPSANEAFGTGLTAADVDADGHQELAHVNGTDSVYVHDFAGSRTPANPEQLYGIPTEDGFKPTGLTGADYDKNGYADLVVTGTQPSLEQVENRSVLLRSDRDGLILDRTFDGGSVGTSGDINKDGYPDLVLGAPRVLEHGEWDLSGGSVQVRYGSNLGLFGTNGEEPVTVFQQGQNGVPGVDELGDDFGGDVSLGDVNGDGYLDLAIGSQGEGIGDLADAGAVWLLRGSARGVTSAGVQNVNQDTAGVPGAAEQGDFFGAQARLIDSDRDGHAELVTTAPDENVDEGFAWVLDGTSSGLTTSGSWSFGAAALAAPQDNAHFGSTVAK
ncbi:FG-GAP-like repeat-containing protein [Streptomyces sp. NPDC058274]|uniref:FG-GAP-like repeat-containing protein n=1 Tax=Streptomyces sp. NPDC058274 TaxID=3346416 RepID=UPI0036E581A9